MSNEYLFIPSLWVDAYVERFRKEHVLWRLVAEDLRKNPPTWLARKHNRLKHRARILQRAWQLIRDEW